MPSMRQRKELIKHDMMVVTSYNPNRLCLWTLNILLSWLLFSPSSAFQQQRLASSNRPEAACTVTSSSLYSLSSSAAASESSSALSTTRIPLTRIFNGEREYLFTTRRNVRSFEWTITEIEDLYECIESLNDNDDDQVELNALTILPVTHTSDPQEQRDIGRTSQIYDVRYLGDVCLPTLRTACQYMCSLQCHCLQHLTVPISFPLSSFLWPKFISRSMMDSNDLFLFPCFLQR